ncbi:MAG: GGDEF domain-containing protein [Spirochaetales bacterium]|nr:GGDEF domain-containing protein [Spirochaetales bacterium]
MIIVMTYLTQKNRSFSTELFLVFSWSTLVVLILDSVTWIVNGSDCVFCRELNYLSNFLLFLLQPVPITIWLLYVDFTLNKSKERLKKCWFYYLPFIVTLAVLIVSIFTDCMFYIDENNIYQRESLVYFLTIFYIFPILYPYVLAFRHKNCLDKKILTIIVSFGLFPLVGMILQIFFYSGPVAWPGVAITIVYVYLFLQTQKETRDYLTGLLNRQQIDDIVQLKMKDYPKNGGFALVMIDVDNFKKINDVYGHSQGDEALVQIATILFSSIRSRDYASRFGGDEFLLLLDTVHPEDVEKIISRFQAKIDAVNSKSKRPYKISLSPGYTIYSPEIHSDFISLFNDVDRKMYKVKKERKDKLE